MRRWAIGAVTVSQIVEQVMDEGVYGLLPDATVEEILTIGWLRPEFATAQGGLSLSIHALVVDTPGARILVDTCVGNDKDLALVEAWHRRQGDFLQRLETAGFPRESIDYVVCTHLHLDHVGWNTMLVDGVWRPTFPNARYLFARAEYAHLADEIAAPGKENGWRRSQRAVLAQSVQPVIEAGLVDLVETDHVVCPEVRFRPTPGHTPAHVSIAIESEGERALITGDFIHHPCQIARPGWGSVIDVDRAMGVATREAVLAEAAGTPLLMIGTHWTGAGAGRVERDGPHYRLAIEPQP
jgi:glyoxylase-like metal-dependent hydrolase (beta-lactamase superfamily II)